MRPRLALVPGEPAGIGSSKRFCVTTPNSPVSRRTAAIAAASSIIWSRKSGNDRNKNGVGSVAVLWALVGLVPPATVHALSLNLAQLMVKSAIAFGLWMNRTRRRNVVIGGGVSVPSDQEELLRALHDEHAPALWRYVVWLCGDRQLAEDIVQETLLRAWRRPVAALGWRCSAGSRGARSR